MLLTYKLKMFSLIIKANNCWRETVSKVRVSEARVASTSAQLVDHQGSSTGEHSLLSF